MTYDPLYRLTSATGTEKGIWQDSIPWQEWDTTAPNHVIREYIEHYTYNKVGFILTQRHQDLGGSYQRLKTFAPLNDTNQMGSITTGSNTFTYNYDAVGNLIQSHG